MAEAKVGSLSLRFPLFRVFILLLFIIHFSILIFDLILFVVDFLSISCQLSIEQDQTVKLSKLNSATQLTVTQKINKKKIREKMSKKSDFKVEIRINKEEKTCQTRFVYMSKIQEIKVSKLTLNCLLEARNDLQLFVVPE